MLKCVSRSYDSYFYYYYFKDESGKCFFWKTKSAKLENAAYNEGRFLKPFNVVEWKLKDKNREVKFYNNEAYQKIVVEKWKLVE